MANPRFNVESNPRTLLYRAISAVRIGVTKIDAVQKNVAGEIIERTNNAPHIEVNPMMTGSHLPRVEKIPLTIPVINPGMKTSKARRSALGLSSGEYSGKVVETAK
jgi:hypothetical protein